MSCHLSATENNLLGFSSAFSESKNSSISSKSTARPKPILFNRHKANMFLPPQSLSRSSRLQSSRRIKSLRKIEITVFPLQYGPRELPVLTLTLASRFLLHLPSFRRKLNMYYKTNNLEKIFGLFSEEFRHLSRLSTLTIKYFQLKFFDASLIEPLLLSIRHLTSLSRLLIHFDESKTLPIEFISEVLSALRYLSPSLQVLDLKFNGSIYSFSILESIKRLRALTALAIDIKNSSIPLNASSALVARDRNLHHSLNSTDQRTIDEKLSDGYLTLKQLSSLNTLALSFSGSFDMIDKQLEKFCESLVDLKLISTLQLSFNRCSPMTDENIRTLTATIKNIAHLTALELDFSDCSRITDNEVGILLAMINKIEPLQRLNLNFSRCSGVSDRTVQALSAGLNENICSFALMMNQNYRVTDKSVESVAVCLMNLNHPMKLSLTFSSCINITDIGAESLLLSLRGTNHQKMTAVNFTGCYRVRLEYKREFEKITKYSKVLK